MDEANISNPNTVSTALDSRHTQDIIRWKLGRVRMNRVSVLEVLVTHMVNPYHIGPL